MTPEVHQRNPWFLPIQGLRTGREQHVTRTNTYSPTHRPTQHHSPPLPSPLPPPRTRKRTCTCTCICVCVCICIMCMCMCAYVYVYESARDCARENVYDLPQWFHVILANISYRYKHIKTCHHESSRKPQHSKWNCVGTTRPRHIHMNAPKIRIVKKI